MIPYLVWLTFCRIFEFCYFSFELIQKLTILKMAVLLYFTEKHLIFVQKQYLTKKEKSCNIDKDYG